MKHEPGQAEAIARDLEPRLSPDERLRMAQVGMRALIDEATGYQNVRPKDDLRKCARTGNSKR
jgi:hypothetical protein